jgi:hypothetical protein
MNKTENQASGVCNSDTPPFAIKPTLKLHNIFKCGDPKSQKDSAELVYFDHGLEVRMNRHDIELMGEELEEAEELIVQYQGHISLCLNVHGQLLWGMITSNKPLDPAEPNLDRKVKNALRELYPASPIQVRKYLFIAIKFHLNYLEKKHTWLDEFSLANFADADFLRDNNA